MHNVIINTGSDGLTNQLARKNLIY